MSHLPLNVPQFFFDEQWIARQSRLTRHWLPATVHPEPVLKPEKPWESPQLVMFGTTVPKGTGGIDMHRLYYSQWRPGFGQEHVLLATSGDGLHWERPSLGAVEHQGRRDNNIVLSPAGQGLGFDSPSIAVDDRGPRPWKIIAYAHHGTWDTTGRTAGLFTWDSPDGIHFQPAADRPVHASGDRTNVMLRRVDGRFVCFGRSFDMMSTVGARAVYRFHSDDFLHWSNPALMLAPDLVDGPEVEYYGMSGFVRHGWHLGLLEYWHSARDVIETYLVFSRDGVTWRHPEPRRAFIAATYPWNRAWSTCSSSGPLEIGDSLAFHFGGRWTAHSYTSVQQLGVIGVASLGLDRFCALEGLGNGRLETPPLLWPGGELVLNADTRMSYESHPGHLDGQIGVEVVDEQGRGVEGYSGGQAAVFRGNTHCRGRVGDGTVRWPDDRKLAALTGRPIGLRFGFRSARLFTFMAAQAQTG